VTEDGVPVEPAIHPAVTSPPDERLGVHSRIEGAMPSDPSNLQSVACLLYLAADQIAPRGMSGKMLKATKVPCRPVWVQPIRLSATIAAATFLNLWEAGGIKLDLQEVTFKDPTYKMPPGRLRTHQTLTMTEADATTQGGLAEALLAIARDLPDGLLGQFGARGGLVHDVGLQRGIIAYPFARNLVRTELLDLGYYRRSHPFRVQPDCEQIATLDQASTATVDWWERQQATEPELCAALLAVCTRASIPRNGGDEMWIVTK
jgi:hypothetical protein